MKDNTRFMIKILIGVFFLSLGIIMVQARTTIIVGGTIEEKAFVKEVLDSNRFNGKTMGHYVYRIDLTSYQHSYRDGYAWYEPERITIYQQARATPERFKYVLKHELGHLIAQKTGQNNGKNYQQREEVADTIGARLLA